MRSRSIDPEWRWKLLLSEVENKNRPDNSYLALVYDVLTGVLKDRDIEYALDLVCMQEFKETIQAFFYCNASLRQISDALEISADVLEHVKRLVMDETQFRNRLERIHYVRTLVEGENDLTERGRECIRMGMVHGPDILGQSFRLGNEDVPLEPKKLIGHFIQTAYYLSANARGNSVTSETVRQARLWMLDILKYIDAYKEADNGMPASDDAILAIEERKATMAAEELGISLDDIYH